MFLFVSISLVPVNLKKKFFLNLYSAPIPSCSLINEYLPEV